ncbi:uncharacterized protein with HEPN domain [Methylobacter tundripaludum]|uniref:Uncharacterized protein with HEPN domain n=1 Tax=Methylobacter tundripaludum TaxID=173365 RepID=A0A2S6H444_9GAMM|nr:DUF86 domain-containing protein [Methylobacter tundripaludum]PPK72217.1 uncharacterized protein with HEPN domain [Methylobacter tundripaludum]
MNENRLPDYLEHMLEAAQQACEYTEGLDKNDFLADKRTQQAVILNLVIIGEAATKLLKDYEQFLDLHPDIPWRSMKGMRNRIAHGYFEINLEVVWDTVQTALPQLLERLPDILKNAGDERNDVHGTDKSE